MSNVYEDNVPDERQTDAAALAPQHTLFRKRYRQLSAEEVVLHDAIKDKADELAGLFGQINTASPPPATGPGSILKNVAESKGAHVTLALRHLEDAVYRAVKALTA
jgi:hypothetical protein